MISINEDNRRTFYITRGDEPGEEINRIVITYPLYNFATEEIELYEFQTTDEITINIYEKKGYTKNEILKKKYKMSDLGYTEPTTTPELYLTQSDTLKFPLSNKQQTFYYEIILNDNATIIGATKDNENKVIVYPGVKEDDEQYVSIRDIETEDDSEEDNTEE